MSNMTSRQITLRCSKTYLEVNGTDADAKAYSPRWTRWIVQLPSGADFMKTFIMAAVAAVSLGMTGAAVASPFVPHAAYAEPARNSVVLPSQRPEYLARNSSVLPSQRPEYLARNSSVLPSQRPAYLA